MGSFFRRNQCDTQTKKDLVYSMVRVVAQNQGDVLYELLELLSTYYGKNSVLSIVDSEYREILATTVPDEMKEAVKRTAASVKEASKRGRYLKEERNGLYFRTPFDNILVIPFRKIGDKHAFLMIEQVGYRNPVLDRCYEVLEIAVCMTMYEFGAKKNATLDRKTMLKTRDTLVKVLVAKSDEPCYVGMFQLLNADGIGLKGGMIRVDRAMYDLAQVVKQEFGKDCYLAGETKIAVIASGEVFDVASRIQSCLDRLVEAHPVLKVGAVLSPMVDEIYRILYLCEKACEEASIDTVLIIRNPEEYLNIGGELIEMIYNGRTGKEVKEVFEEDQAETGARPDPESVPKTEDEYISFAWDSPFPKMEPFDGL